MRIFLQLSEDQKEHLKYYLFLLVICLLAYWPVSLNIFSVKNDAIHYFLPYRFQISEALRNGELPLWSPYIYLGYPIHGDMQSGAWNPVVWLFSILGRYDLAIFHYENLLYIFLGAVGIFKLSVRLTSHYGTSFLVACSYMLSGFMLGGQLINWLAAGAFIPFVLFYYLRTLDEKSYSTAIKTGVCLYLLFTSAYPSFFVLTSYILLLLFVVKIIDKSGQKNNTKEFISLFKRQAVLLMVFTGLSLPALLSFIDLLPFYQRGAGIRYEDAVWNSFEWQHLRTFFFPSTSKAADLATNTDLTCRNIYMGAFILPVLISIPPARSRRNFLLGLLAIFSLLFSLGEAGFIRKFCFDFIPLMDTFRHPSQARLFLIMALLLLAAPSIKKLVTGGYGKSVQKKLLPSFLIFLFILIVVTVPPLVRNNSGLFSFDKPALKEFFDSLTISDGIIVNGIIQIIFFTAMIFWIRSRHKKPVILYGLWILNLFVFCQLLLPATFVSQTKASRINAFIRSSPGGFPVRSLENPLADNSLDAKENFEVWGLSYFYNKKIGISKVMNSPSFLEQQEKFITSPLLYDYVADKPLVYLADSLAMLSDSSLVSQAAQCRYVFRETKQDLKNSCTQPGDVRVTSLSANSFKIRTSTRDEKFLVVAQNYHPHWKATVNGRDVPIQKVNLSFMGVVIDKATQEVIFRYQPPYIIYSILIQIVTVFILILTGARYSYLHHQKR